MRTKESIYDSLHRMTVRVSKGNASEYRSIWNDWKYSELIEFAEGVRKRDENMRDEISEQEYEYVEYYLAALMERMLERL